MTAAGAPPRSASRRPPISAPGPRDALAARQPRVGLLGLLLVVPIAGVLAVGAGGADGSVLVLGPLVTYALPLVAMVAFWWEDWPGTRLRSSWSGWADTALIAAGAVGADRDRAARRRGPRPARHLRRVTRAGPRPDLPRHDAAGRRRVRGDAAAHARGRGLAAAAAARGRAGVALVRLGDRARVYRARSVGRPGRASRARSVAGRASARAWSASAPGRCCSTSRLARPAVLEDRHAPRG